MVSDDMMVDCLLLSEHGMLEELAFHDTSPCYTNNSG